MAGYVDEDGIGWASDDDGETGSGVEEVYQPKRLTAAALDRLYTGVINVMCNTLCHRPTCAVMFFTNDFETWIRVDHRFTPTYTRIVTGPFALQGDSLEVMAWRAHGYLDFD